MSSAGVSWPPRRQRASRYIPVTPRPPTWPCPLGGRPVSCPRRPREYRMRHSAVATDMRMTAPRTTNSFHPFGAGGGGPAKLNLKSSARWFPERSSASVLIRTTWLTSGGGLLNSHIRSWEALIHSEMWGTPGVIVRAASTLDWFIASENTSKMRYLEESYSMETTVGGGL